MGETDPRPLLSARLRALALEHADHVEIAAASLPAPAGLSPRDLVHAARSAGYGTPINAMGPDSLDPREERAIREQIALLLLALRVQKVT